jgi:hypothetical protein
MDATCDRAGVTLPLVQYDHDSGCSITGGYVYRGAQIPALQGHDFYEDFCEGWVRSFRLQGGEAVEAESGPRCGRTASPQLRRGL